MKTILIFALVAIAACSEAPVEQDLQSNIVDTIKCFVEKALPLLPQVTEIITAIKEQDFMTVMMIGMAMYEDIKEMIDVCIPKEKMLASNYDDFIKCSKSLNETSQVVAQLIGAIRNNDTAQIIKFIRIIQQNGGELTKQCGKYLPSIY